ncbi:MAG: hypothetical protein IJA94_03545 [Bacilli bacterium]|nr:hypothetical protein [Bacilli bacterium]
MKKYFKISLILVIVLSLYATLVYFVANEDNKTPNNPIIDSGNNNNDNNEDKPSGFDKEDQDNDVIDINILLSPNRIISRRNGIWEENKNLKYNDVLYDVYIDSQNIGQKYLMYNKKWYIYDEQRNFIDYSGNVLAIKTDKEYKVINVSKSPLNEIDKNNIISILENKQISYNYDLIVKEKVVYDINADGIREEIIFISNAFTENVNDFSNTFSIGFIKYPTKNEIFFEYIDDILNSTSICLPSIQNLVKFENDLHLIVGCTYFSERGTQHNIYRIFNDTLREELKTNIE